MEAKKCSKCGEVKILSAFNKNKSKIDGISTHCKKCVNNYNNEYYKNNIDKVKKYYKKYHATEDYKEKRKVWDNKYFLNNRDNINKKNAKYRDDLSDWYIADILKIKVDICPPKLIELKRAHLRIRREIKKAHT